MVSSAKLFNSRLLLIIIIIIIIIVIIIIIIIVIFVAPYPKALRRFTARVLNT